MSDEKIYSIYKITNTTNDKAYVGYTENIPDRWHKHEIRSGKEAKKFHQAIKKYGWDKFTKEVIYCSKDPIHTLVIMEPYFIAYYDTFKHGYNMTMGGEGTPGLFVSEETKQKMREAHLGDKNFFYGKTHDEETRKRMSTKAKTRQIRYGFNAPNFGKTRSNEINEQVRQKVSKQWTIIQPDGTRILVTNLKKFCKDNNLCYIRMLEITAGKQKFHKGYSIERIGVPSCSMSENAKSKIRSFSGNTFVVTYPDGKEEVIVGMKNFCKTHNLSSGVLFGVAKGLYTQHKGFKCRKIPNNQEFYDFVQNTGISAQLVPTYDRNISKTILQILEIEWQAQTKLVKDRLLHKAGKIQTKYFARNCTVEEIDPAISSAFLIENHIQGSIPAKTHLGLMYNNELVSVMTFGTARFDTIYEWELLRFASKRGISVIGAAGKLFKHFTRQYTPSSIISYSNARWNTGEVYKLIGMKFMRKSPINYFYMKDNQIYSRFKFQKHKLEKQLENYDVNKSERLNMEANGYERIDDAPNDVFVWTANP
jgi:group I intron endonuclease